MLIDKLPRSGVAGHVSGNFGVVPINDTSFPLFLFFSFKTLQYFEEQFEITFRYQINYPNQVDRAFEWRSPNIQNVFQSSKLVCLPHLCLFPFPFCSKGSKPL
jgi:hypothetical protein